MNNTTTINTVTDAFTTTSPSSGESEGMDGAFIVAMACFGAGALLVTTAIVVMVLWCKRNSDSRHLRNKRRRSLDHHKYLEQYSVKTGGQADEYTPRTTPKTLPRHDSKALNTNKNKSATTGNGKVIQGGNGTISHTSEGHVGEINSKIHHSNGINGSAKPHSNGSIGNISSSAERVDMVDTSVNVINNNAVNHKDLNDQVDYNVQSEDKIADVIF